MEDDQSGLCITAHQIHGETTLGVPAEEIQRPKRVRSAYSNEMLVFGSMPVESFKQCMKYLTVREFVDISMACHFAWQWSCDTDWPDFYIWHEDGYLIDDDRFCNLDNHPFVAIDKDAVLNAACWVFEGVDKQPRCTSRKIECAMMKIDTAVREKMLVTPAKIIATEHDKAVRKEDIKVHTRRMG